MVLKIDEQVETKVQVLDSNGDPANGATVNYQVYDEAHGVYDSGTMTEIGSTGVYYVQWTPDAAGVWMVRCYCSSPKFHKTLDYFVETGVEARLGTTTVTSGTHSHSSGTTEQTIVEVTITTPTKLCNLFLDLVNLTKNATVRVYAKIDGTNYRALEGGQIDWIVASDDDGICYESLTIDKDVKFTLQSSEAEGASRNVPYRIVKEEL